MERILFLSSSEIVERRARIAAEEEAERIERNKRVADRLSKTFEMYRFDDFMTDAERASVIAKVEAEGGNQRAIINVIRNEGARINNVDNSDKSSRSTAFQTIVGPSGAAVMPNG